MGSFSYVLFFFFPVDTCNGCREWTPALLEFVGEVVPPVITVVLQRWGPDRRRRWFNGEHPSVVPSKRPGPPDHWGK